MKQLFKDKLHIALTVIFSILAVAINAFIIVHACLDGVTSSQSSQTVVEVVEEVVNTIAPNTINESNIDQFSNFIRKSFGHFGLFMISGVLSPLAIYFWIKEVKWFRVYAPSVIGLSIGLILGILTEIIQTQVPGRSGEFSDVLIDFSGFVLGALILFGVLTLVYRKKLERSQAVNLDKIEYQEEDE